MIMKHAHVFVTPEATRNGVVVEHNIIENAPHDDLRRASNQEIIMIAKRISPSTRRSRYWGSAWIFAVGACASIALTSCGSENGQLDQSSAADTDARTPKSLYWNLFGSDGHHDLFRVGIDGSNYQTAEDPSMVGFAVDFEENRVITSAAAARGLQSYSLTELELIQPTDPALADVEIDIGANVGPKLNTKTRVLYWAETDYNSPKLEIFLRSVRLSDGLQTPAISLIPPDLLSEDEHQFYRTSGLVIDHARNVVYALLSVTEIEQSHELIMVVDMNEAEPKAEVLYKATTANAETFLSSGASLSSLHHSAFLDQLLVVENDPTRTDGGGEIPRSERSRRILSVDRTTGATEIVHDDVPFKIFVVDAEADRIYYYVDNGQFSHEGKIVAARWSDLAPVATVIDPVFEVGDLVLVVEEEKQEALAFWDSVEDLEVHEGGIFRPENGVWGGAVSAQPILEGESFRFRLNVEPSVSEDTQLGLQVACGFVENPDDGYTWADQKATIWARSFGDRHIAASAFDKWAAPAGDRFVRSRMAFIPNTFTSAEFELRREDGRVRYFFGVPEITPETEKELKFDGSMPTLDLPAELFPRCTVWESDLLVSVVKPDAKD